MDKMDVANSGSAQSPELFRDHASLKDGSQKGIDSENMIKDQDNNPTHKQPGHFTTIITLAILWLAIIIIVGTLGFLLALSTSDPKAGLMLLGALAFIGVLIGYFALTDGFSPLMKDTLLPGGGSRKATSSDVSRLDKNPSDGRYDGKARLHQLRLAEKCLDAEQDARLITQRDGVVVFANTAYRALARDAHARGPSGMPPRIERLFAQQGAEAMKIFRLCRAARSGDSAREDIYRSNGSTGGARNRFEVSVAPVADDDLHVVWTLRELPVDDEDHDELATAFAEYLRPVFALERSGQIAWANRVMREKLGIHKGSLHHIDDLILGDTEEVIEQLWSDYGAGQQAKVRRHESSPIDAVFASFQRGGKGEGFICVEMTLDEDLPEADDVPLSGEISDAPFGVASIEGELSKSARIVEVNKAFIDAFGDASKNTQLGRIFSPETIEELAREVKRKPAPGSTPNVVEVQIGNDATARVYALYVKPVGRRRGGYGTRRVLIFSVDITDRKRMELDYGQDQKLKAIGNLAGEVAHDFNNFLQTILGNCELLMMNHPLGDPSYDQLVVIRENSQRLANLTKQLLAFSRKQTMQRKQLSLTELLRDFTKFLDRAVGEKVQLELINGRGLKPVRVDQNQLESAIMNLAVNARDAMGPDGGTLTIRTFALEADDILSSGVTGLAPEDHVVVEVSDTGPGVPADIADKIFDPFFTTKEEGKGTGLGLSTVHGVIGQMGGVIILDREAETGAIFRIYLPAVLDVVDESPPDRKASTIATDLTGAGRILVVEDEDAVRDFVIVALKGRGYEVSEAPDGSDALEVIEAQGIEYFDLIISDVMMGEMDGPVFIRALTEKYGRCPRTVFMSGYAESAMRDQLGEIEPNGYLQKPFSPKTLATMVKDQIGIPA